MPPELSRRIALAINQLEPGTLTLEQRFALPKACEDATTFEELPDWVRTVVEQGEAAAAAEPGVAASARPRPGRKVRRTP